MTSAPAPAPSTSGQRVGVALCLLSAVGFGAMAIFAKYAYDAGVDVMTLLTGRFAVAASFLWIVVALRRGTLHPRPLLAGAAFGAFGYALQAGLFFTALERVDAAFASLVLYGYPAMVTLVALVLGLERPDLRRWCALALASAGLVLVLGGAGAGTDVLGGLLALASGAAYTVYILGSDRFVRRSDPLSWTASVCTGAFASLLTFSVVTAGGPAFGSIGAEGWAWIVAIGFVSTVLPLFAFAAGLSLVGPGRASILSTIEPPITVLLAFLAFGETLSPVQLLGGALVLSGAVLVVRQAEASPAAPRAAAPAPARADTAHLVTSSA